MASNDRSNRFYWGTKGRFGPGDLIETGHSPNAGDRDEVLGFIYLTDTLDAAAWQGETAPGEGPGRIYLVEPTGPVMDAPDAVDVVPPVSAMSHRSEDPVRITRELTDSHGRPPLLYHGTKADLRKGDLIEPGHSANFGAEDRLANFVYLAGTLDAAIWGAELALGERRERIYLVEPTGPIMDDPNLTNTRFQGNPTKSYRSSEPLRVIDEVMDWEGHTPDVIKAMRERVKELEESGAEIDD